MLLCWQARAEVLGALALGVLACAGRAGRAGRAVCCVELREYFRSRVTKASEEALMKQKRSTVHALSMTLPRFIPFNKK